VSDQIKVVLLCFSVGVNDDFGIVGHCSDLVADSDASKETNVGIPEKHDFNFVSF